jgi:hypothetical protein
MGYVLCVLGGIVVGWVSLIVVALCVTAARADRASEEIKT